MAVATDKIIPSPPETPDCQIEADALKPLIVAYQMNVLHFVLERSRDGCRIVDTVAVGDTGQDLMTPAATSLKLPQNTLDVRGFIESGYDNQHRCHLLS